MDCPFLPRPLNPLSPGARVVPDRIIPEPIRAAVGGELGSELEGAGGPDAMECGYRNASDRMVILRCLGPGSFFLERVVFPFELLSFACPPESEVEIFTHSLGGPELLESMPARTLRLDGALTVDLSPVDPLDEESPWAQAG